MNFEVTQHAAEMIERRSIEREWLHRTLENPELVRPDERDPTLEHRLKEIPEYGDRVLRVIINTTVDPVRVVTVYFDRTMKGEL